MPVTPEELHNEARTTEIEHSEVRRRKAASQMYYAAYHLCRPIAQQRSPLFGDVGGVHAQVIDALQGSREGAVRSLGAMLRSCKAIRIDADYHIEDDFTMDRFEAITKHCERIWAKAQALKGT